MEKSEDGPAPASSSPSRDMSPFLLPWNKNARVIPLLTDLQHTMSLLEKLFIRNLDWGQDEFSKGDLKFCAVLS